MNEIQLVQNFWTIPDFLYERNTVVQNFWTGPDFPEFFGTTYTANRNTEGRQETCSFSVISISFIAHLSFEKTLKKD
jgi:hypothetical protein